MRRRKKQEWHAGDEFRILLADGECCWGSVVSIEPDALNSAVCVFYQAKTTLEERPRLNAPDLLAALFVTRDLLDSGDWKVVSSGTPPSIDAFIDLPSIRKKGYVGVKIVGSRNVIALLNAFHRLVPWNSFHDENYLDRLLLPGVKRPSNVLLVDK